MRIFMRGAINEILNATKKVSGDGPIKSRSGQTVLAARPQKGSNHDAGRGPRRTNISASPLGGRCDDVGRGRAVGGDHLLPRPRDARGLNRPIGSGRGSLAILDVFWGSRPAADPRFCLVPRRRRSVDAFSRFLNRGRSGGARCGRTKLKNLVIMGPKTSIKERQDRGVRNREVDVCSSATADDLIKWTHPSLPYFRFLVPLIPLLPIRAPLTTTSSVEMFLGEEGRELMLRYMYVCMYGCICITNNIYICLYISEHGICCILSLSCSIDSDQDSRTRNFII